MHLNHLKIKITSIIYNKTNEYGSLGLGLSLKTREYDFSKVSTSLIAPIPNPTQLIFEHGFQLIPCSTKTNASVPSIVAEYRQRI